MQCDGQLWRGPKLRQVKYLNNIVEQDHRRIKRLTGPGLGFGGIRTTRRILAGFETMAMIRKGQVTSIEENNMRAQAEFVSNLFQMVPETLTTPSENWLPKKFATQPGHLR
jgi:IS6 family transposase